MEPEGKGKVAAVEAAAGSFGCFVGASVAGNASSTVAVGMKRVHVGSI